MKISTKLVTMLLIGSLTTVFASDSTQETQMTRSDMISSIEKIQEASPVERMQLVNKFKSALMTQTPEIRTEAMSMYNSQVNNSSESNENGMSSQNMLVSDSSAEDMNQNQKINQNNVMNQMMSKDMGSMQQNSMPSNGQTTSMPNTQSNTMSQGMGRS